MKLVVCAGTRTEEDFSFPLFRHWVRHYLGYGFRPEDWLLSLFSSHPDDNIIEVTGWLRQQGIEVQSAVMNSSQHIPQAQEAEYLRLRADLPPEEWVVIVDADEFIEFPDSAPTFFSDLDQLGFNAARGYLVDRHAPGYRLAEVNDTNLFDQFPMRSSVSRNVANAIVAKMCGFKNRFTVSLGHHWIEDPDGAVRLNQPDMPVHHFKWTRGLLNRLQRTMALPEEKIFWQHENLALLPFVTEDRLLVSLPQAQLVASV